MTVAASEVGGRQGFFPYPDILFLIVIIYFILSFFSVLGESQDWENYNEMFDGLRTFGATAEGAERIEIGFKWLAIFIAQFTTSNALLYAVLVSISVTLKSFCLGFFAKNRSAYIVALLFYFICFSPLHEFTQIRVALAIALLFSSYASMVMGRPWLAFMFGLTALLFHLSAVIALMGIAIAYMIRKKLIIISRFKLISFAVVVFFLVSTVTVFLLSYFEDLFLVVSLYQQMGFGDEPANRLSPSVLANICVIGIGLVLWSRLTAEMQGVLAVQLLGLAVFYSAIDFPVVAFRIYESLQPFLAFYVLFGLQSKDAVLRGFVALTVLGCSSIYSYIYFFKGEFFL